MCVTKYEACLNKDDPNRAKEEKAACDVLQYGETPLGLLIPVFAGGLIVIVLSVVELIGGVARRKLLRFFLFFSYAVMLSFLLASSILAGTSIDKFKHDADLSDPSYGAAYAFCSYATPILCQSQSCALSSSSLIRIVVILFLTTLKLKSKKEKRKERKERFFFFFFSYFFILLISAFVCVIFHLQCFV